MMKKRIRNTSLRSAAVLLSRILMLFSLPFLATQCVFPKKSNTVNMADSVSTPVLPKDTGHIQVDTVKPNYYNPEIQTDYGVIQFTPRYDTLRPQPLYGVKPVVRPN